MKPCLMLLLLVMTAKALSQPLKLNGNNIILKRNDIIRVVQSGKIVTYNLKSEKDQKNLSDYLKTIPSVVKQLNSFTNPIKNPYNQYKNLNSFMIKIARGTGVEEVISLDEYTKRLEKCIIERKNLTDELTKIKAQTQNSEFQAVLVEAENKLEQLDDQGYQRVLNTFKHERVSQLDSLGDKLAETLYLQALNNYSQFYYTKALQQLEEALTYSNNIKYKLLKGKILTDTYQLKESQEIYISIYNNNLTDTLKSEIFENLGYIYALRNDYQQAEDYYQKALEINLKILGADRPSVASVYNNLGYVYASKGQFDQALVLYSKALEINLKTLGPTHASVASVYNNLGSIYASRNEYQQAEDYYRKALEIDLKTLGPAHPSVASAYNSLGSIYALRNEYQQAEDYYRKALEINLKILGPAHPSVASAYNNLGSIYISRNAYQQAEDYYRKALEINLKILGANHPSVASAYNNLGSIYVSKGQFDQALVLYSKALEINLKTLGPTHASMTSVYNNLGSIYASRNEYQQAEDYYRKALEINLKTLGPAHPSVANAYNNLGSIYASRNEYQQAEDYYRKALEIDLKTLGPAHPSVASAYNSLGSIYALRNEYQQAEDYYRKALEINLKILGPAHPSVANAYKNINFLNQASVSSKKAEIEQFIKNIKSYYRPVVNEANNNYLVLASASEKDKSLEYYKKGSWLSLNVHNNLSTALSKNNIGYSYASKGNYSKALEYYFQALTIQGQEIEINNSIVQELYQNIGFALIFIKNFQAGLNYLEKVHTYNSLTISGKVAFLNTEAKAYNKTHKINEAKLITDLAENFVRINRNIVHIPVSNKLNSYDLMNDKDFIVVSNYLKNLPVNHKKVNDKNIENILINRLLSLSSNEEVFNFNSLYSKNLVNDTTHLVIKSYPYYIYNKSDTNAIKLSQAIGEFINRCEGLSYLAHKDDILAGNKKNGLINANLFNSYFDYMTKMEKDLNKNYGKSAERIKFWNDNTSFTISMDSIKKELYSLDQSNLYIKKLLADSKLFNQDNYIKLNVGNLFELDSILVIDKKYVIRLHMRDDISINNVEVDNIYNNKKFPLLWKMLTYSDIDQRNSLFRILLKYSFILEKPLEDVVIEIVSLNGENRYVVSWQDALMSVVIPRINSNTYAKSSSFGYKEHFYINEPHFNSIYVSEHNKIISIFLNNRYKNLPKEKKKFIGSNQLIIRPIKGLISGKSNIWEIVEIYFHTYDERKYLNTDLIIDGHFKELAEFAKPDVEIIEKGGKIEKLNDECKAFSTEFTNDYNKFFQTKLKR